MSTLEQIRLTLTSRSSNCFRTSFQNGVPAHTRLNACCSEGMLTSSLIWNMHSTCFRSKSIAAIEISCLQYTGSLSSRALPSTRRLRRAATQLKLFHLEDLCFCEACGQVAAKLGYSLGHPKQNTLQIVGLRG